MIQVEKFSNLKKGDRIKFKDHDKHERWGVFDCYWDRSISLFEDRGRNRRFLNKDKIVRVIPKDKPKKVKKTAFGQFIL